MGLELGLGFRVYGMVVAGGVAPEGAVAAEVVDVDVYALGVEPLPTPWLGLGC